MGCGFLGVLAQRITRRIRGQAVWKKPKETNKPPGEVLP